MATVDQGFTGSATESVSEQEDRKPKWIITVILILLFGLGGLFFTDRLFNPEKFQIDKIEIIGRMENISSNEVKQVVNASLHGNYFSASLGLIESKIEKLPWVFSASIRRKWPSTLVVEVTEVQPVAKWGESKWMHITGDLFEIESSQASKLQFELPKLNGADEEAKNVWKVFQNWSKKLSVNGLVLNQLRQDPRGLWYLSISLGALSLNSTTSQDQTIPPSEKNNQVVLVVDRLEADKKLDRFITTLNRELIMQFPEIKNVDLRYSNGFAVGWKELSDSDTKAETVSTIE